MKDYNEYQCRIEIGAGHRKFGPIAPRKELKDDEGGAGSAGFVPPTHPILGSAVQFSGDFDHETANIPESVEGKNELKHRLEAKNDKKQQAEKHINPSPSIF